MFSYLLIIPFYDYMCVDSTVGRNPTAPGMYKPLVSGIFEPSTIVSPLSRVIPIPNGLNGLYMGVTNHLLNGMILQA